MLGSRSNGSRFSAWMTPAWIRIGAGNHSRNPLVGSILGVLVGVGVGNLNTSWMVGLAVGASIWVWVNSGVIKLVDGVGIVPTGWVHACIRNNESNMANIMEIVTCGLSIVS